MSLEPVIDLFEIDFPHLFILFIIYAFLGWCGEEIWCGALWHKIAKRGMLYGTICPIYGCGAVAILYLLHPFQDGYFSLLLASILVTSGLEYFTSWLLEKLFHAKWWDYSQEPFNLKGRCCLLNSVVFGLAGVALMHLMHPIILNLVYAQLIQPFIPYIFGVLLTVFTADLLFTIRKLVDFNTTMAKLKQYEEQLKERFQGEDWFKDKSFTEMVASIKEKAKQDSTKFSNTFMATLEKYSSRQKNIESWIKKFPTMTSKDYGEILSHVKNAFIKDMEEQKRLIKNKKKRAKAKINYIKSEIAHDEENAQKYADEAGIKRGEVDNSAAVKKV